ncbi:hypothetical protein MesoLj113b_08700 [Mesorhizobium sp. 113-3-3]|nr:hypothetical protein MesoLj113b_08700 [Mesorhizobium sp. 113-3-3]
MESEVVRMWCVPKAWRRITQEAGVKKGEVDCLGGEAPQLPRAPITAATDKANLQNQLVI